MTRFEFQFEKIWQLAEIATVFEFRIDQFRVSKRRKTGFGFPSGIGLRFEKLDFRIQKFSCYRFVKPLLQISSQCYNPVAYREGAKHPLPRRSLRPPVPAPDTGERIRRDANARRRPGIFRGALHPRPCPR